jgi:DNA-binding MarR family transcriptional regulator
MYVLHPHSRLSRFYAVYIQNQWRLNPENLTQIAQICSSYLLEQPIDLYPATVDRYLHEQVALKPDLTNLVVTELYQKFSIDRNHRIWVNFIHYMSEKLISNMWNRLPEYKRVEETLELFRNATLVEPEKIFKNFNPVYDRDLLNGIERWTYRFLRNSISSQIRERDQFFGLSSLGVVSKSTKLSIRNALSLQISNHLEGLSDYNLKDRSIIDPFLVDVYKDYLKRTQIRTNNLAAKDWEEINIEIEKKWSELDLDLPPPSIEKIQAELKIVGSYVRKAASISIDSFDVITIPLNGNDPKNINREDESVWCKAYEQLFETVKQTIFTLEPSDVEILELRYRDGLIQSEISLKIGRDQTIVSRKISSIEKMMLKNIYKQIRHPDDETVIKIDRTAIQAMKEALRIFYSNQISV